MVGSIFCAEVYCFESGAYFGFFFPEELKCFLKELSLRRLITFSSSSSILI